MLIKCPECQLQISDKAIVCPHCGYPLKPQAVRTRPYTGSKKSHKRLPNGFGQISMIKSKNLRKPYRAMVTVGKNEKTGRPVSKLLQPVAYFETYNDAYEALLKYNKCPEVTINQKIKLKEVYDEWSDKYYKTVSLSTVKSYKSTWNHLETLHNVPMVNIRAKHIRELIDECDKISVKKCIHFMMNVLFDYAVENEYVDRNYSRELKYKFDNTIKETHHAFKEDELDKLWANCLSEKYIDIVLIQCYTGLRPRELCNIKIEDVDLDNWTITGGMKTEAGKNRTIPIHEKIKGFVKSKYEIANKLGSEYLINVPSIYAPDSVAQMRITYDRYKSIFTKAMENAGINGHRPHDPRKTFITLAKKYNMNEYAIKLIAGHTISDVTESVYTERDPKWFHDEINKIEVKLKGSVEEIITKMM